MLRTIMSRTETLPEFLARNYALMPRFAARSVENDAGKEDAEKNDHQDICNSAKPATPGEEVVWNGGPTKTEKSAWMTDSSAHSNPTLIQEMSGESGK